MPSFSQNLLTGYQIGSNMRSRLDTRKKQKGMRSALEGIEEPRMQTEQEAMLEEQTAGVDEQDAQSWRPTAADWGNMRTQGAQKILDSGGSLEDVERYQAFVDQKQKTGIEKYSNLAATALEKGDIDAAAKYMDVGYGYMDDGVLLQTANVDGQLMAFPKDEKTGELLDKPIPVTPEMIRRQAQAFTDQDAFLRWSWGKHTFEKEFGLKQKADTRAEEAQPGKLRKTDAEIAKLEQKETGVVSGKGGTGEGGLAAVVGWKINDLNSVHDDVRKTFSSYNEDSVDYAGVPRGKEEIYSVENAPKTQALTYGLIDVNPGISAGAAVNVGEKLAQLRAQGNEAFSAYMNKNVKPDPNSPSGFSVRVNNQKYNLPIRLAPDRGQAAEAYFAKKGVSLGGAGGVAQYQKRAPLSETPWYQKKYGIEQPQARRVQRAVQAPQTQAPRQALQGTRPSPPPPPATQQAVPTQPQAQPPAEGLSTPGYQGGYTPDERSLAVATQGGSLRRNSPTQRAINTAVSGIREEIMQWYDPQSKRFDMDRETIKEFEGMLRGLRSQEADRLRDILKEVKKTRSGRGMLNR